MLSVPGCGGYAFRNLLDYEFIDTYFLLGVSNFVLVSFYIIETPQVCVICFYVSICLCSPVGSWPSPYAL